MDEMTLSKMLKDFEKIYYDENYNISTDFYHWKKGTSQALIMEWFEDNWLVMAGKRAEEKLKKGG